MAAFDGSTYGSGVSRNAGSPSGGEPLVPTPVSAQIIQGLPKASTVLARSRRVTMSTLTQRQPVLSVLPQAYFLNTSSTQGAGDFALKKTTQQQWKNLDLCAEEIAVILPIPEAYLADAQVDIWGEVRPRIVSAFGALIDLACLFGTSKPAVWGSALVTAAAAAGNTVTPTIPSGASGYELGVAIAKGGRQLKKQGFGINGFVAAPGFGWELASYRTSQGIPIYSPNVDGTPGGNLYGFPTSEAENGGFDDTVASLIYGDWSNAIVGLRQDITFKVFTEGVIQDNTGAIVLNLMQEDSVALRCTMRMAWQIANPITEVASRRGRTQFPFGYLTADPNLS